jgi:hypothetical protein
MAGMGKELTRLGGISPAGDGRDDQPGDNAFLAKKCQQTLSIAGTISSSWLIL